MCSSPDPTQVENEKASLAMTQMLQADYGTTFAKNQAVLGNLTTTLNNVIAKPQGFSQPMLNALRTGAMDTTATQFGGARAAAGAAAARYGGDVASGVTGQIEGQLAGEEASAESGQQNQITIADAQQQQANYWKGIQGLTQVGEAYNPTGYAGAATGSTNATTNAAAQTLAESQASWNNTFGVIKGITGLASAGVGMAGAAGAFGGDSGGPSDWHAPAGEPWLGGSGN